MAPPRLRDLAASLKTGGSKKRKDESSSAVVPPVVPQSEDDARTLTELVDLAEASEPEVPLKRKRREAPEVPAGADECPNEPGPPAVDKGKRRSTGDFVVRPKVSGRSMTLEDSILSSASVAAGVIQSVVPPRDITELDKLSAEDHLIGAVHSSFVGAIQSLAALHRVRSLHKKNDEYIGRLRESERAGKALTADLKAMNVILDHTKAALKARDADAVALQQKADVQTSRLLEAERSAVETKAELAKALVSLAEVKAESEAQYDKGFDDAGESYEKQVQGISEQAFREGWIAALRAQGLDKASTLWTAMPLRSEADLGSDAEVDAEEEDPASVVVPPDADADTAPVCAEASVSEAQYAEAAIAEAAEVVDAAAEAPAI